MHARVARILSVLLAAAVPLALLVGLAAGLPGCRAVGPDHSQLDATAARALVREQARALRDLSASVSLSIETAEFEGSLSGALVVAPPTRLRLRATKLMQDVFDLVITPEELSLFWFRDGTFFRRRLAGDTLHPVGEGTALPYGGTGEWEDPNPEDRDPQGPEAFLAQLDPSAFRLALATFELPLSDEASDLPANERVVFEATERTGGDLVVRAQLASGDRLERRFDGRTLFLEEVIVTNAAGERRLRATYDDHELVQGFWLPTEMALEDAVAGTRFEMNFDEVAVNEGVLPGAFVLIPPPGVEAREL